MVDSLLTSAVLGISPGNPWIVKRPSGFSQAQQHRGKKLGKESADDLSIMIVWVFSMSMLKVFLEAFYSKHGVMHVR